MKIQVRSNSLPVPNESTLILSAGAKVLAADLAQNLPTEALKEVNTALKLFEKGRLSGCELLPFGLVISNIETPKGLDTLEQIRLATKQAAKEFRKRNILKASILAGSDESELNAICEGLHFADYRFDKYKSSAKKKSAMSWTLLTSITPAKAKKIVLDSQKVMESVALCRDLVNEPGGAMRPQEMVQVCKKVASKFKLKIKIRDEKALAKEKFNGLLAVGRGGMNPPHMVTLSYNPAKAPAKTHLVLVGKGVTFDTGGLSLKPSAKMWEMRMDMAGSASVVSAIAAIAALKIPVKVSAVLCLTENRPGKNAILPGDIFTAKNGKTVMVENTDAEGRLVLSDGLAEAGLIGATHIVDLATLTGAVIRAIGPALTGLFSNDDQFAEKITQTGKPLGEKFWQLPLEEEYRETLTDKVADLKNIGGDAGAITAGLFLQEFVPQKTTWAHLDIAGTAFTDKPWKYYDFGATGWGVRTLVQLATSLHKK